MMEFLNECIAPVNVLPTVLLGLVLAYWLFVIIGAVGVDSFDFDFDADVDVDVDIDVDIDGGVDGAVDGHGGSSVHDAGGSFTAGALNFMHASEVPILIIVSVFVMAWWLLNLVTNHFINPDLEILTWSLLTIPNLIFALVITKVMIYPLARYGTKETDIETKYREMIGTVAKVKTTEVTEKFGQIELEDDGPPVVYNARTNPGEKLVRGDAAKIIGYDRDSGTYLVELTKWENKTND